MIADSKLGLKDIILEEPSVGGRDLYTRDNSVAIQARLLVSIRQSKLLGAIQSALLDMVDKLRQDYGYQPNMKDGYAILPYIDPTDGMLKTIIVEVPRP